MSNALREIRRSGQSIWLDFIARSFLRSGALSNMVDTEGLLGMTSNPAIFQKAIAGSDDYDDGIRDLLDRGVDGAMTLYERLAIEDIQEAAELLRPVYDETDAEDGYVSLEVSPYLAHDTVGTIEEARRLFRAVDRPNVMIKIPGTPEGIPAIRTLIAEGIPINVTLLFSLDAYDAAAQAYLAGLEDRVHRGLPLNTLASVASFFVSRIDVAVDEEWAELAKRDVEAADSIRDLSGRIAIANAKLAYARFQELIASPRWKSLAQRGAFPQRLLWASTGTKNPEYPKTYYVHELNGPDTVDTLPLETFEALREEETTHSGLTEGLADAREQIARLEAAGISLDAITDRLLVAGLASFAESFDVLLASVEKKRVRTLGRELTTQRLSPGPILDDFTAEIGRWQRERHVARLWAGDSKLWTGQDESDWLGWLHAVEHGIKAAPARDQLRARALRGEFDDVVVLGMGGSSLCPWVLAETFDTPSTGLRLHVLDSVVPEQIRRVESAIDLERTLFIVASKSGGTVEPNSLWSYFRARLEEQRIDPQPHAIAITDPGSSLETVHKQNPFRALVHGEPSIGGRYSALSPFGLIPAALMGLDVDAFLASARRMAFSCGPDVPASVNPGAQLGLFLGCAARAGRDKLSFVASPSVASFGAWLEQLVAESTGKRGVGIVPISGEKWSEGETLGHDRVFVYLRDAESDNTACDAWADRLEAAGHPVARIEMASCRSIGQEFFRFEMATAVAGAVLGIHPFDQPDVEAAKIAARARLADFERDGRLPVDSASFVDGGTEGRPSGALNASMPDLDTGVAALVAAIGPGDYFAIQAYLEMSPEIDAALESIRNQVRHATGAATTVGYGPRFLHSTGQLHKGGANNGVFLLLTADSEQDLEIPGSRASFATLTAAQARGDFQVLDERGRRVVHLHFTGPVPRELTRIAAVVSRLRQHGTEKSRG